MVRDEGRWRPPRGSNRGRGVPLMSAADQPVSQVTETLGGFATGHVVVSNLATSLMWCLGLLAVFGGIAVRMEGRRQ